MKLIVRTMQTSVLFIFSLILMINVNAQTKYTNKSSVSLTVSGTSTLHDWDMKSAKGNCDVTFILSSAGVPTGLSGLAFSTQAQELKSGHDAMDKNAYKALKIDKNPAITFTGTTATFSLISGSDYQVKTNGKLTIAGKTLDIELTATCKVNADKSINVMGSKKISMKEFDMTPPSFMLGTIKTGNDVTLKFDMTLYK